MYELIYILWEKVVLSIEAGGVIRKKDGINIPKRLLFN